MAWTKAYGNWALDSAYMSPPQGVNESVYVLGLDSAGRLIAGGLFTQAGGVSSPGLARFFSDGTRDPSFDIDSGVADGTYNYVNDLIVLPDDSVIIVGDFGSFNGVTRGNIARIKADGSVDPDFANGAGADAMIRHIEHSGDGGYIIGGNFSNYDGVSRSRIAKLYGDGSLDNSVTFDHSFAAGEWVDQIEVFDDGAVLAAGDFAPGNVKKFLVTGATDSSFQFNSSYYFNYVEATLITSTGKILIGGTGGLSRNNGDGTWDSEFNVSFRSYTEIYGLLELPDGRIVVTGEFGVSGTETNRLVVLDPDGSVSENTLTYPFEPSDWVGPALLDGEDLIFAGRFSWIYSGSPPALAVNRIARFNTNPVQNPPNAVYFDRSAITLIEGDRVNREFQLKIDETPEEPVTVFLEVAESIPEPNIEGFPSVPNSIPVPWDGPNHTGISIRSDQDVPGYQGTRRVTHRIRSVSGGAVIGEPSEIEIILLDDEPHPNVRFAQSVIDVVEGHKPEDGFTQAAVRFDSEPDDFAAYRIEVVTDDPALADRVFIPNYDFYLNDDPIDFEIDIQDDDDQLTGPIEVTLRIVPDSPGAEGFLGSPTTMTLRILDNEVAGGIRFDRASLDLVSGQDGIEVSTLISGVLHSTELFYEIEYANPEWEGNAYIIPFEDWIGGRSRIIHDVFAEIRNESILSPGTARIHIRTDPEQPELLGEPSVLELKLYDDRSLDGWLILQYPEDWDAVDILKRDGDSDGHNTLLEWFNETDPEDASHVRAPKAELVRSPYLDQGEKVFLALRFYLGTAKPSHVAIVQTIADLSDPEWTTAWRSDEDPNFDSEQVVEKPHATGGWAVIRLPAPVSTQGFVRLKVEPASK